MTKRVYSPIKYPGGKGPIANWIVSLMPPHLNYVEPYFGGGSVFFAKDYLGINEVVNDLNGDLMNFWSVLQSPEWFELFRRGVEATPFSEREWEEAKERLDRGGYEDILLHALDFFIVSRQSLAGRKQEFTQLSKTRTRRGMNEQVSAWLTAVEGLPAVHERLKRVAILNRLALDVIKEFDGPDTLFYLDPPYLHETRVTKKEYGENEMTQEQHAELLGVIAECKGKVMLSGYRSEFYDKALNRWTTRHEKTVANHASHKKAKPRKVECLWCNW